MSVHIDGGEVALQGRQASAITDYLIMALAKGDFNYRGDKEYLEDTVHLLTTYTMPDGSSFCNIHKHDCKGSQGRTNPWYGNKPILKPYEGA